MNKIQISVRLLLILTCYTTHVFAQKPEPLTHQDIQTINLNIANHRLQALAKLQAAYPEYIKSICQESITWADGTNMLLNTSEIFKPISEKLSNPTLTDQLEQVFYKTDKPTDNPNTDPGRIRYEPFFRKMYGNSPEEVGKNLELVFWMPNIFGPKTYPLQVTKINNIHEKIMHISDELEILVLLKPEYAIFLQNPGGTFVWRTIAGTNRLSAHSFGMTIDINAELSEYWQWDLKKENLPITEDALLTYRNSIPWEIVEIFEKYGFIWGGKWLHYDTMHFEYRPELIE